MKILVTGGAGYIGSVTVELLRAKGEEVVVLDDLARGHRASLDVDVPFYHGTVGDRTLVCRIASEHEIEACIHFAGLINVGESVLEPKSYFENNVAQGMALLGALLDAGVRRVVFSSSCAVYGEPARVPIPEECSQWPKNPYGWSKFMMERVLEGYSQAYGLKFVVLRYFNAAGATTHRGERHEPETHLIPNVLAAAAGDKPEAIVFGNDYSTPDGTCIRDYVHVVDLAEAHILALNYLRQDGQSDFINLGTGRGYSVLEVIEAARRVTGAAIPIRIEARRSGDSTRLVAKATKASSLLGWKPAMSDLASILRSQWDWRRNHPKGYAD